VSRWAGRVAFVLAVAVGGGWAASLILSSFAGRGVSAEAASILSTIGGVLAGGIAAYLGNSSAPANRDSSTRTRSSDTATQVLDNSQPSGLASEPDTQ
jgi:uncharacterized membrane protein YebE (DUF533 family)